ncbi:hypothetical protein Cs7R123_64020 [Catellatospora sp. TT07R-123]|uniref:hypothetical protein n=1 Tax=Catellatospora sp. TT07R-123 TaxID=2733863 RepID=UPI001B2EEC35|nr:hypothetical protein [Catellatospora sp. TT07R-123]GHJ49060.1 hypothetical protein Cs7R123_64020 [Catellatospora sp. TT07R-123]
MLAPKAVKLTTVMLVLSEQAAVCAARGGDDCRGDQCDERGQYASQPLAAVQGEVGDIGGSLL